MDLDGHGSDSASLWSREPVLYCRYEPLAQAQVVASEGA